MADTVLFDQLADFNRKPDSFSHYTTPDFWNDDHISQFLLEEHLRESSDLASRNKHFMERSITWIRDRFHLDSSMSIIDFGCGPGLYANALAETGASATGIDVSSRSIDYAKRQADKRNLSVKFICENYLSYDFSEKYDLIIMIFCDYCVLSPAQRQRLLSTWNTILKKGGNVLLDVSSVNYLKTKSETRSYEFQNNGGFWSQNPYFAFYNLFLYDSEKLLLEQYNIIEDRGKRTFYNWLQCFSIESMKHEIEKAGFKISDYYANVAGDDYTEDSKEIAVVMSTP